MADTSLLERTLAQTVPLNKARCNFLAKFLTALLQVKTVNLVEISNSFAGRAKPESSYKRIQRFLRFFALPYSLIATAVVRLLGVPAPWVLTMDRTQWQCGQVWVNILVVGLAYKGVAIPLLWTIMQKKGCANSREKIASVRQFVDLFGAESILYLTADREFADRQLFRYLQAEGIDFRIRLKRNAMVANGRGALVQAWRLFRAQPTGQSLALSGQRKIWQLQLHLTGMRLPDGDYLIVAAPEVVRAALIDYRRRWEIETLFGCLKSRGFRLEETHLKDPERLQKLVALLALAFCWAIVVGQWLTAEKPLRVKKHGRLCKSLFRHGLDHLRRLLCNLESVAKRSEFRRVILLLSCT